MRVDQSCGKRPRGRVDRKLRDFSVDSFRMLANGQSSLVIHLDGSLKYLMPR